MALTLQQIAQNTISTMQIGMANDTNMIPKVPKIIHIARALPSTGWTPMRTVKSTVTCISALLR